MRSVLSIGVLAIALPILAACASDPETQRENQRRTSNLNEVNERESILDLFNRADASREIAVNKYLWTASLDVLSFLPLEAADPFSGVISTGWGRVNGTSTPYRATVYVSGPALEARSLRVAVFRQSGGRALAVSDEVAEQIEDSILTRARQLIGAADRRGT